MQLLHMDVSAGTSPSEFSKIPTSSDTKASAGFWQLIWSNWELTWEPGGVAAGLP